MKVEIEWNKFTKDSPAMYDWYLVAVDPINYKECSKKGIKSWRDQFGCTKAWFHNGEWYEPDPHGYRTTVITDRVTHWANMPIVP